MEFWAAARIFASTWLGRYIPGKIWTAAGKVYLGNKQGFDLRRLSISVFFELTLSITAQAAVALILIFLFLDSSLFGSQNSVLLVVLAVALVMVGVHPAIFSRVVNYAMNWMGKKPIDTKGFIVLPRHIIIFVLIWFSGSRDGLFSIVFCAFPHASKRRNRVVCCGLFRGFKFCWTTGIRNAGGNRCSRGGPYGALANQARPGNRIDDCDPFTRLAGHH